jgi:predicted secreted protein
VDKGPLKRLLRRVLPAAPASPSPDARGRRVVAVIECVLNQNVRDAGAADSPAMNWALVSLCHAHGIGIVQLPCPEIACLGTERARAPGFSLRDALNTDAARAQCAQLAVDAADRLQAHAASGCEVLAVLGGNRQSPGCAVCLDGDTLQPSSGQLMRALQVELRGRGMEIPFRGLHDAEPAALVQDLAWLEALAGRPA